MIGMLWYDNGPAALGDKIKKAAGYYREKYGRMPNLCFVHPSMGPMKDLETEIKVKVSKSILPNHLWLGIENEC